MNHSKAVSVAEGEMDQAAPNAPRCFAPGFRLSLLDVIVLIGGGAAAALLWRQVWWWGYVVALVVGHFFLFCNVFRISRTLELLWAAAFIVVAWRAGVGSVSWELATVVISIATIAVITREMTKLSYHGIYWQRINPSLPAWWQAQKAHPSS